MTYNTDGIYEDADRIPTDYSQEKQQDPSEFDGHMIMGVDFGKDIEALDNLVKSVEAKDDADDQLTNDMLVGEGTTKGDVLNMVSEEKV